VKEHIKRRIEYSKDALPNEGTPEYDMAIKYLEAQNKKYPDLESITKQKYKEAVKTLEIQCKNGIGLNVDPEIRHFLLEFNHRSWTYGHRKMPVKFNIMEAFFTLDKRLNYWSLHEEEDYSISFFDFIDYYTSNDFTFNISEIKDNLEEGLIYNFNVGSDLKEITFKTEEGKEFIIAGVSLIRRGNEVTLLFVTGQITDTSIKTKELSPLNNLEKAPGKEELTIADDRVREAVKLGDDPNLWKTLIACRFDLDTETLDARYVAKDEGNSYSIITDDLTGFMHNGEWRKEEYEDLFKSLADKLGSYNSIFEIAKACLYLPKYFNFYEDEIIELTYDTEIKTTLNNPYKKRSFNEVQNKLKIRNRPLWTLKRNRSFLSDRVILRDDKFKVETSGYWKKLDIDEIGTDKNNKPIKEKTWVKKTESYYSARVDELIVEKSKSTNYTNKNSGFIYIMRNGNLGKNVYKIGLTTKTTDERAKQLSKTSIPDKFIVMREWNTKDCYLAEKKIHELLSNYRVDKKREFFEVDMKTANDVIDSVIDQINR
jgi:hypothetical protein